MTSMDLESVRSGHSERSNQSRRSHGSSNRRHRRDGSGSYSRPKRSLRVNMADIEGGRIGEEMIEVQIIPQDDNWGENTTCITGNTSEVGGSFDDISKLQAEFERHETFHCSQFFGTALAVLLSGFAFVTPVGFLLLPEIITVEGLDEIVCDAACEGLIISIAFKLLILLIGAWALFFRKPKSTMPRAYVLRGIVLVFTFILTFSFWLFFVVRILAGQGFSSYQKSEHEYSDFLTAESSVVIVEPSGMYYKIVQYAATFVDVLLFTYYLAVVLLEIRHSQPLYTIRVVRSPDGERRSYNIGQLSVQRAAAWVLEQYYKDFSIFNPYLENVHSRAKSKGETTTFKFYDLDGGVANNSVQGRSRAIMAASARRRDMSHNERFYEELEYERKVRRRRARLMSAAEEAFTHIKRLHNEPGPAMPMDPHEAAQAVFPSLARALQKYLRTTRQQPYYTLESIIDHLAVCISHDMSPKAFLERYLHPTAGIFNNRDYRRIQTWALVCDMAPNSAMADGHLFQLKNGDVGLLVEVRRMPHYNITEEVIDPKNNKFILRLNSETSV